MRTPILLAAILLVATINAAHLRNLDSKASTSASATSSANATAAAYNTAFNQWNTSAVKVGTFDNTWITQAFDNVFANFNKIAADIQAAFASNPATVLMNEALAKTQKMTETMQDLNKQGANASKILDEMSKLNTWSLPAAEPVVVVAEQPAQEEAKPCNCTKDDANVTQVQNTPVEDDDSCEDDDDNTTAVAADDDECEDDDVVAANNSDKVCDHAQEANASSQAAANASSEAASNASSEAASNASAEAASEAESNASAGSNASAAAEGSGDGGSNTGASNASANAGAASNASANGEAASNANNSAPQVTTNEGTPGNTAASGNTTAVTNNSIVTGNAQEGSIQSAQSLPDQGQGTQTLATSEQLGGAQSNAAASGDQVSTTHDIQVNGNGQSSSTTSNAVSNNGGPAIAFASSSSGN